MAEAPPENIPAERPRALFQRDPVRGCLLWLGRRNAGGYGVVGGRGRQTILVHRMVYEAVHGPIPVGMVIRHRCDVRRCAEPRHLLAGTQADNMADMKARHRGRRRATPAVIEGTAMERPPVHVDLPERVRRLRAIGVTSPHALARAVNAPVSVVHTLSTGGPPSVNGPDALRRGVVHTAQTD